MKHERYRIRLKATLESLADVRRFVSRVAGLHSIPGPVRDDIVLAAYEGCANVIEHAYRDGDDEGLCVEVEVVPPEETNRAKRAAPPAKNRGRGKAPRSPVGRVTIYIYDSGPPFQPPDNSPEVWELINRGADGGLGLWMIRNLMDEVSFYRRENLNVLEMTKAWGPGV